MTNSATLIFSRLSELESTPLISILHITALTEGLNGTYVSCMEVDNRASTATTTIYIYGDNHGKLATPQFKILL